MWICRYKKLLKLTNEDWRSILMCSIQNSWWGCYNDVTSGCSLPRQLSLNKFFKSCSGINIRLFGQNFPVCSWKAAIKVEIKRLLCISSGEVCVKRLSLKFHGARFSVHDNEIKIVYSLLSIGVQCHREMFWYRSKCSWFNAMTRFENNYVRVANKIKFWTLHLYYQQV